jgi:hypothetical protein
LLAGMLRIDNSSFAFERCSRREFTRIAGSVRHRVNLEPRRLGIQRKAPSARTLPHRPRVAQPLENLNKSRTGARLFARGV